MYKFTAYITLRDGTRLYAKDYGLKAFRILVGGSANTRNVKIRS